MTGEKKTKAVTLFVFLLDSAGVNQFCMDKMMGHNYAEKLEALQIATWDRGTIILVPFPMRNFSINIFSEFLEKGNVVWIILETILLSRKKLTGHVIVTSQCVFLHVIQDFHRLFIVYRQICND